MRLGNMPAIDAGNVLLVESIDATRTMLLHASRAESIRVVAVTSAVKGEGKTSLASHLGASLARAGRRTLLIDGDLRSPSLHRLFDAVPGLGLCELIKGEVELEDVIQKTHAEGLDLITAGRCDPLALQLLAQDELRFLFSRLKSHYDFVIVDCAPVLPVVDTLLIGQSVDGVLFSILRDVSRLPQVHAACERLTNLGTRLLGAVVSGVRTESYSSSYYAMPLGHQSTAVSRESGRHNS